MIRQLLRWRFRAFVPNVVTVYPSYDFTKPSNSMYLTTII